MSCICAAHVQLELNKLSLLHMLVFVAVKYCPACSQVSVQGEVWHSSQHSSEEKRPRS